MSKFRLLFLTSLLLLGLSLNASASTLSSGMSGSEVTELQNNLVAAGYLARTVDGDYGSTTAMAVRLFQEDKGLPVTGTADDATQNAIAAAAGAGYRNGGGVVLAEGNRGDSVIKYQQILQSKGYLSGGIDGVYGEATTNAVAQFQRDSGFPVSGAIDEMTLHALDDGSGAEASSSYSSSSSVGGTSLYGIGDAGSEVQSIQQKLKRAGYLYGAADGIYGDDTANAVRNIQRDNGLSQTGNVDNDTLYVINTVAGNRSGGDELSPGSSGDKVIELQNMLLLHGFNPGSVDGQYGPGTEEAVRELQSYYNLPKTGVADETVWQRLERAPEFTGNYEKIYKMEATAYTPWDGDGAGITYGGNHAGKGHAAVDPNIIPLGSILYIQGYGYAIADDIGSAITGNHIDVGVETADQAYRWGTKRVNVYLIH